MNSKRQTTQGRRNTDKKIGEKETVSFSNLGEFFSIIFNFSRYTKKQKVIFVITIIVFSIYPLWRVTENWRNQHFIKEKIYDYFISLPNPQTSNINVAIFQLKNDITTDKELSIQDLFISKFQYPFINYTKYSLPLDPDNSNKAKEILKKCQKEYDIVIWGNSIWRDGSKKYKLNYSSNVSNVTIPESSLSDGEFAPVCYQKFNAIIPSVVLRKIERLQLLDDDKYEERLLMDFFYLERDIIQNDEIMKYVSTENKQKLLEGAASIGYTLGKAGNGKFYLDESIEYISQTLNDNIDYDKEMLLGKLQYESGILNLYYDYFEEGVNDLNNSIKTFRSILQDQYKYIEKWEQSVAWLSTYLPQDREIKRDSTGKLYYEITTPVDNSSLVSAAMMIVPLFDETCISSGICQGLLGKSLYQLGCQKNDSSLVNEAKGMFVLSVIENLREHYMTEYDYNKYSPPSDFDDVFLHLATLESDTSIISSFLARQNNSLYYNITSKNYPYTWANVHYRISCGLGLLGQINNDLTTIMKAIEECKMALNTFNEKSRKSEWYNCQHKIAELYLIAYLLSKDSTEKKNFISKSIRDYQTLIDYYSAKGNSFKLADNILDLSIALYINNLYSEDKKNITLNIEKLKKHTQIRDTKTQSITIKSSSPEDKIEVSSSNGTSRTSIKADNKIYSIDGYATLKLADGIMSLILNSIGGDSTLLEEARISLNEAINNFSHSGIIPKKAISYSITSLIMYQIWSNTYSENDLREAKEYANKSIIEFNEFMPPTDNSLIIHEFKSIVDKIKNKS